MLETPTPVAPGRAPYGRHTQRDAVPTPLPSAPRTPAPYQGPTYYGLPALKPGHYKWLIVQYFTLGGLSGSAQLLAAVADLAGGKSDRAVVRWGRYLGLAGAVAGPVLLIADLHMPSRFYNMLRIARGKSPMSFGAWTLAGFGTASGLAALGQLVDDITEGQRGRLLGRFAGLPAAALGAVMSYYTGPLLTATSVPFWAAVPRLLPALFAASSVSTAAAALTLALKATDAPDESGERLEKLSLVAGAADLALAVATERAWHEEGVAAPVREQPLSSAFYLGAVGVGMVIPLAVHGYQALTGRRSKTASTVAAVATLVGGFLLRTAVVFGGRQSAERPEDYFHFTRPEENAHAPDSDRVA